jgi:predicted TIM-barrel fold metal-dependent hydrolase
MIPKIVVEVDKRIPSLKIVISHLFWPKDEYCVDIAKDYSNISYDTSALADKEVVLKTGEDKIKSSLEKLIKEYNRKVLYGSDYGMCDIQSHLELINNLDISNIQREAIFYENITDTFGI